MNFGPAFVCLSVIFFYSSTSSQELLDFFIGQTDVTEQSKKNDEDGVPRI